VFFSTWDLQNVSAKLLLGIRLFKSASFLAVWLGAVVSVMAVEVPVGAIPSAGDIAVAVTASGSDSSSVRASQAMIADSAASDLEMDEDTTVVKEEPSQARKLYEYIAYPTLQVLTWPIETLLAPTVEVLVYPIKPPLRYLLNENVIDRTISMLSFGPGGHIMVYPTLSIAPGTGSRTGATFRHQSPFGRPTERFVGQWTMFVNGDYRMRAYLTARDIFGSDFSAKVSAQLNRVKNTGANQPGENAYWYYADTSETYYAHIAHPLFEKVSGRLSYNLRISRFGLAPPPEPQNAVMVSSFFKKNPSDALAQPPQYRGLESEWLDNVLGIGIGRDSRNNENITLDGSNFKLDWSYHRTNAGHDFQSYQMVWAKYFKLGKEHYELTRDEEKEAVKKMKLKQILEQLEYRKLREQLFNRKVLAFQWTMAESFELKNNRMPVYGLQTLGNDTPLRGYAGSRFRDLTVGAISAEYRFPLMRLVDGDIFNEYGVHGKNWGTIDYLNFKNSWGFGIRVRRPDIFLFRCEAGFHGSEGIVMNLTVDAMY
jgi:hypothetical protein